MNESDLKEVLRLHKLWLEGDSEGVRANLQDADLRSADLLSADLLSANLQDANLWYANLQDANLRSANLRNADLRYCVGNGREVISLHVAPYVLVYVKPTGILHGGCTTRTVEEWLNLDVSTLSSADAEYYKKYTRPFLNMVTEN